MSIPISQHFALDEFKSHDGTPYPAKWIADRLKPLCAVLEALRADLGGRPVEIISGYRSPAHNLKVGGAKASQHMAGRAADIAVHGLAPSDVHLACLKLFKVGAIEIGGLGVYPAWVHIDVREREGGHLAQWTGQGVGSEVA